MIDTLILSGGGPSGIAYAGILKALTLCKIINKSELKEIITASVGIMFSILYLLDYTIPQIEKIALEIKIVVYKEKHFLDRIIAFYTEE